MNHLRFFSFSIIIVVTISSCSSSTDEPWVKPLKTRLEVMADSLTKHLVPWEVPNNVFNIVEYGAVADGTTLNTVSIQKAIDECSAEGGGVVLVQGGDFATGTIDLKSGVMLEIAKDARLLGSTSFGDYPERIESLKNIMSEFYEFRFSLIYAEKCKNIGIRGEGEIYFRGEKEHFSSPQTTGKIVGRPLGIRMIECQNVVLQNITLRNSAAWMQNYVHCNNLIFEGVKVYNHANYNNDGLDPDGCTNVIVRNCFINSEDDAMCLKGGSGKPSKNILIENSTFYSTCNAFKIGTDTQGDFFDILVRNVTLGGIPDSLESIAGNQASSGITLVTVDGGDVYNFYFNNITINQARCPIFMRIGNRFRLLPEWKNPGVGDLKNIVIENVTGKGNYRQGSFISGIKDKAIENIVVRNVNLEMEGIEDPVFAGLPVDENEKGYPDAHQFSVNGLPAYGFFVRHAMNVSLQDVKVKPNTNDARPEFIVAGLTENITANGAKVAEQQLIDFSYDPQYIKNLVLADTTEKAVVLAYKVGSRLCNDRTTVIINIPEMFQNAEYIQWSMNLRSNVSDNLLSFDITVPGTLYIAHDSLYTKQIWLTKDFKKMDSQLKVDNWEYHLYSKEIKQPGRVQLGGNHIGELPVKKGQNYVVIFVKN